MNFETASSQKLRCRGVVATAIPNMPPEENRKRQGVYGAIQFELFSAKPTAFLNCERAVSVTFDSGKWSFAAAGVVQSFEETEKYRSRRVVERFTREMLIDYCNTLGIDAASWAFYRSPSILISSSDPLPEGAEACTIVEAQNRIGIRGLKNATR